MQVSGSCLSISLHVGENFSLSCPLGETASSLSVSLFVHAVRIEGTSYEALFLNARYETGCSSWSFFHCTNNVVLQ